MSKYFIALCLVTFLGTQLALAEPNDIAGTGGSVLVTIPGVSTRDIFLPLANAIFCLRRNGSSCTSYGFPADVLVSAYGLNDKGRILKPELWRIWVPRLEGALIDAKRGSINSEGLPQFEQLDIPGLDHRLYDLAIVRSLVATDLFPYSMRITYRRMKGVKIPFVRLQSTTAPQKGALLAKTCFGEAENGGTCPNALIGESQQQKSAARPSLINQKVLLVGFHSSMRAERMEPQQAANSQAVNYCSIGNQDLTELKQVLTCLKVVVDSQGIGKPVELRSREGLFDCVPFEKLDKNEKQDLEPGGCLYRLNLIVTQSAGGLYDRVKVRVFISDQIRPCGPPKFGLNTDVPSAKFNSYEGCTDHQARFSVSHAALNSDPGSGRKLALAIYSTTAKSPTTRVVVVLLGVDKGLLSVSNPQVRASHWCWPTSCDDTPSSSDMTVVNSLRSEP